MGSTSAAIALSIATGAESDREFHADMAGFESKALVESPGIHAGRVRSELNHTAAALASMIDDVFDQTRTDTPIA
jgi:hypothetical protein